jgi:hypothetical protein
MSGRLCVHGRCPPRAVSRIDGITGKRIAIATASVLVFLAVGLGAVPGGATAAEGNVTGTIQTDYFTIEYTEGTQAEAEQVATFADDYYEVLFQRFGVGPVDQKIPVRVLGRETINCDGSDAEGCYRSGVEGRIYITSDDRSHFYHELTHRFQARAMEGGRWINPPGSIGKFDVFVEGTARFMDSSSTDVAAGASFQADDIDMTTKDAQGDEYDDLALFAEFILHEYGREGFDMLYTSSDPREVASLSDGDYPALIQDFYDQLPEQRSRMESGGAPLVGFTYDPFLPEPGSEVTFDARTPDAVEALDRSWYNGSASSYEWDFDDDGEIDASGPTVTRTISDPANTTVTLYVTVDGERRKAEQALLDSSMALERSAVEPIFRIDRVVPAEGLQLESDIEADRKTTTGTPVSLNVTVENRGIAGSERLDVTLAGREITSRTVELGHGEQRRIAVSGTIPADVENGTYDLDVGFGNKTVTRTVRISQPEFDLQWSRVRIPNGSVAWRANRMIKPGKDVEVEVEAWGAETGPKVERTVQLYAGDERVGEKRMTFGSGETAVFEFTAPENTGPLHIRGVVPPEDRFGEGDGFSVEFEIRERAGDTRIHLPQGKGGCTLTITDVSVDAVYRDGSFLETTNVTEIRPDDDLTIEVTTMRNGNCTESRLSPEFTVGEETVMPSPRFSRKFRFDMETTVEEPGTYEIRYRDTLLDTLTVDAADSGVETSATEAEKVDDTAPQSTTTDGSDVNASDGTPGFGIGVAAATLLACTLALVRRRE